MRSLLVSVGMMVALILATLAAPAASADPGEPLGGREVGLGAVCVSVEEPPALPNVQLTGACGGGATAMASVSIAEDHVSVSVCTDEFCLFLLLVRG